jgi:hypothetical protein
VNDVRRDATENTTKLELGFQPRIFTIFPLDFDNFQCFPVGSVQKSSENSRQEYCFLVPDICFVSLQDPVIFPNLSCKILRDPMAGMIELGYAN